MIVARKLAYPVVAAACLMGIAPTSHAQQLPTERHGEVVPRDVREIYDKGVQYLARTQGEAGDWSGTNTGETGPGITGMGLMVFLASGEDPNFGLYASNVRKAIRSIITAQDADTGYMGHSMYHHGFGMLALAEAYGVVDERNLWPDKQAKQRSIGQSLELAVRATITSQKKNPLGGVAILPSGTDADTSVSGAVLVGLLARNAGIEVPDESIDKALEYFKSMTSDTGQVGYSGGFGGFDNSPARMSISRLVHAAARRKDVKTYKPTLQQLTQNLDQTSPAYPEYTRYYQSQALFQGDVDSWEKWNKLLVRQLKSLQGSDGSFQGQHGPCVGTSLNLLALALNYKFLPIYER